MVKNHLKSVKDITAPLNWQSSPDSPSTQLAYVTQDEIDMMVDANIHGSMDGSPNVGPKGIMSLDGGDPITKKEQKRVQRSQTNVNTRAGQDARQRFRDKTGSNVVTDKEAAARERQGRPKAVIRDKGMSDEKFKKKWGVTKAQTKGGPGRTIPKAKIEKDWGAEKKKKLFEQEKANLKKIKNKISSGFNFPTAMGMGMDFLQTLGLDKREIIMKLYQDPKGSTLTPRERKAVAGLIASGKLNPNVFKTDWTDEQIGTLIDTATGISPDKEGGKLKTKGIGEEPYWGEIGTDEDIRKQLKQEYGMDYYTDPETNEMLLKGLFKDDKDYEKMIRDYEMGKPTGLGGIFGIGEGREEGTTTLEDLREGLTSEEEHYLKMNRPDLYYKFNDPQTSGGISDLANLSTQGLEGTNPDLVQKIFDARQELDRRKDRHDGGGGITALLEGTTPPGTTPPGTTPPGTTPPGTTPGDDQWMTASAGQIGYYNPEINPATGQPWGYQWGTTSDYNPYAEVNLAKGGIIGMDDGGYLDDYQAADSLMFKDPQEDEEWEYNV